MLSKTVTRLVDEMRRRRNQVLEERRTPDAVDLTLLPADEWERDAVALWCSQRKRNPHNPDFRYLPWERWIGAWATMPAPARKMLFDLWRVTPDRGAIAELMGRRELTVGVALSNGFVVGDELANLVQIPDVPPASGGVPVIPIAREVCLFWRLRPPDRSRRLLHFRWLDDAFVDVVNVVTAARSRVLAGPCRAQLERLLLAKPSPGLTG